MRKEGNMAGKPPKISIKTKNKKTGEQKSIIAVWENDGRLSFTLDRSVAEIRFADGTTLTPSDFGKDGTVYGNVYEASPTPKRQDPSFDDQF